VLDYVCIDTNIMPFEDEPGHPEKKIQNLLPPSEMAGGMVRLSYWPPGFTQQVREEMASEGHRHYHRTVTERHYVLWGDYTIFHWHGPKMAQIGTDMYRHHYIENPPLTQHGITIENSPVVGNKLIAWATGPGSTSLYSPESKQETVRVPFDGEGPPEASNAPIIFNADDLEWQPHPNQPNWLIKYLSRPDNPLPPVSLVNVPAGSRAGISGLTPANAVKHWLYVVSGDLKLKAASKHRENVLKLKEGGFLAWNSECAITQPDAVLTDGGCVILCIGHVLRSPSGH
jgi:hypothetical protein